MGDSVGLFLSGNNDYQHRMKEDALQRNKHLGFTVDVRVADNDPSLQAEQVKTAVDVRGPSRITAVLVSPVNESSLQSVARSALASGIDWVLLNRRAGYMESLSRVFPMRVVFSVLPDQREIGRIQGAQARALAAAGSYLLCITGRPDTWSAEHRLAGLNEVVGRANPIVTVNGDWTTEGARQAVTDWLVKEGRGKKVGVFVAQNDDMAVGVRQAVRAGEGRWPALLEKVPILGCDGSSGFGQRLVLARHMAATVVVSSAVGPALTCLRRARDGEESPPPHVPLPVSSFPAVAELSTIAQRR